MVSTLSPDQLRLVMRNVSDLPVTARQDVRGYEVKDAANEKVGEVDDLVIEVPDGRVRLLKVGSGGLLGFGREHRLVPVDVVSDVAGGTVFLDTRKARVDATPTWGDIDGPSFLTAIFDHYGLQPYWSAGYREPDWTGDR